MSDNRNKNTDKNAEHILVCISSSPSNTKIIQTASSMAKAFGAMFSALYIKTPSAASLEPKDKERLLSNIHFAEECGASVTTVCGDDIPFQIAEYARLSGVTKIVIGRSVVNKKTFSFAAHFDGKTNISRPKCRYTYYTRQRCRSAQRKGKSL